MFVQQYVEEWCLWSIKRTRRKYWLKESEDKQVRDSEEEEEEKEIQTEQQQLISGY